RRWRSVGGRSRVGAREVDADGDHARRATCAWHRPSGLCSSSRSRSTKLAAGPDRELVEIEGAAVRGAMLWFDEAKDFPFILTDDGRRVSVERGGFVIGLLPWAVALGCRSS